eukprot:385464-Hanusia_phi.AAC.3
MAGREAARAMVEELGRSERLKRGGIASTVTHVSEDGRNLVSTESINDVVASLRSFLTKELRTYGQGPSSSSTHSQDAASGSLADSSSLHNIPLRDEPVEVADESGELLEAMGLNPALSKLSHTHASLLVASSKRIRFAPHDPLIDTRNRRLGHFFLVVAGEVGLISRNVHATDGREQGCGEEEYRVIGEGCTFGSCSAVASGETLGLEPEAMREGMKFEYALRAWGKSAGVVRQFDRKRFARSIALLLHQERQRLADSLLRSSALFSSFSHSSLLYFADYATRRSFLRSCPCRLSQVAAESLLVIEEGSAWISMRARDLERDVRLMRVAAGQMVHLGMPTDNLQLTVSAESKEISLIAIPREKFEKRVLLEDLNEAVMDETTKIQAHLTLMAEVYVLRYKLLERLENIMRECTESCNVLHLLFLRPVLRSSWGSTNQRMCRTIAMNSESLSVSSSAVLRSLDLCRLDEPSLRLAVTHRL